MNLRPDLLALTPDDLAVLTNRGTVKRAQREVETGKVTVEWETDESGRVMARWSDAVECVIPAGQTVKEARCSCPAAELCRHLVRTVLAWQRPVDDGTPGVGKVLMRQRPPFFMPSPRGDTRWMLELSLRIQRNSFKSPGILNLDS